jgi:hypothetical protein
MYVADAEKKLLIALNPVAVGTKYAVYSPEQFIDKWEFRSLTQGNRPQFSLKGANITEEEEYEF